MTTTAARASETTQTRIDLAMRHSAAEYAALLAMVDGFSPDDWSRPTDCTEWAVRDLVAHVAGAAEEACRLRVALRHQAAAVRGVLRDRGFRDYVDYVCAAQIDERRSLSDAEIGEDLRRWAVGAPQGRRDQPRLVRAMRLPKVAGLRTGATGAYAFDVIYNRDTWLHRVDLHRATGVDMPRSAAEPEVVAQVVKDLALDWDGPAFVLTLTGRVTGCWVVGAGDPVATVTEDAVSYLRLLSGRSDECILATEGDASITPLVRAARVVF